MTNILILLLNLSSLSNSVVQPVVDALNIQIHRDFSPAWGIDATVQFAANASGWTVRIEDRYEEAGVLGYHDVSAGIPFARVFQAEAAKFNRAWSSALSHEILEMLANPYLNTFHSALANSESSWPDPFVRFYLREVTDPIEHDLYSYKINGVTVSDFVFPSWFGGVGPYDFTRSISNAWQIMPKSHATVYDSWYGQGWRDIFSPAPNTVAALKSVAVKDGADVVVTWNAGKLLGSNAPGGLWREFDDQSIPHNVIGPTGKQFFKTGPLFDRAL